MEKPEGLIKFLWRTIVSLSKGMRVTFGYFSRPSTVVTQQYPENREELKMFDRFRSQLVLSHDEHGEHKCNACRICEQSCPNASIIVYSRKGAQSGRTELESFLWRLDSCTFCNACVMVCPHQALKMNGNFESSVFDRGLLIYNLAKYAGPSASSLQKVTDPEERKKLKESKPVFTEETTLFKNSKKGNSDGDF